MNELQAHKIIAMVAAAFPNWRPDRSTRSLFRRAIEPMEAALAEEACKRALISDREFAPSIGWLWREAAKVELQRAGREVISAEEAWQQVNDAIHRLGWYQSPPAFANAAIARTVNAMGWREICCNDNIEATRAHFFRLFSRFEQMRFESHLSELSHGILDRIGIKDDARPLLETDAEEVDGREG
jgi:hypothetical protein